VSPLRSDFGLESAPDSIHFKDQFEIFDNLGVYGYLKLGRLAMASEYPSDSKQECFEECLQECLVEPPLRGEDEPTDADNMISLLEENARLRGLVLKLTNLILKNAADLD
jgi:hypothetical protein